ncbi:MAG TPA: hypothetical protein VHH36_05185 [Candidatus Thermoplasmatota archaeon]|nr:hypothetical protein [Candidatus Thermoplasmatota archaeon]
MELLSLFIGSVVGVAATAIAWNLTSRAAPKKVATSVTSLWSLKDVVANGAPAVIAERIDGVKLPMGSKVIVPTGSMQAVDPEILMSCEVRMHPEVRLNAVVGKDEAVVFSGHVAPRSAAVVTTDEQIVRRLQNDFSRMWAQSSPHVETVEISSLAGKQGRVVDVTGRAIEVMEFRGRKMLRLTDGKVAVGVVAKQQDVANMTGANVRVVGRLQRDGAYPYIEATELTVLDQGAAVPA